MSKNRLCFPALLAFVVLCAVATAAATTPPDVNDGAAAVWKGLNSGEKIIALGGYEDCAASLPRPIRLSWEEEKQAARIDQKLTPTMMLPALLFSMRGDKTLRPSDTVGEHYAEKYGFHKGEWWMEIDSSERAAYLRGIAWCSASFRSEGTDSFTTADVDALVAKLNRWFGVGDDASVPASRSDVAVYVGLRKLGLLKTPKTAK